MISPVEGHTSITSKALTKIVSLIGAESFGVEAKHVRVDLGDDQGLLVLRVTAPIRAVALGRVVTDPSVLDRSGGTLLQRAAAAQDRIRTHVSEITGYQISRVEVYLNGVDIRHEVRVK
jgi:uncharacterized alkaline shock family protein YloU